MTLPLIYALNKASSSEKRQIINTVKNYNRNRKKVLELIQFVKDKGGLSFAKARMEDFRKQALELLFEFPKSEYRDALELMVNFVIERKI
jgi:octaprenyl-diphosphate synthase